MSASGPGADIREAPINFCFRGDCVAKVVLHR
jgi:hypothetical protein